LADVHVACRFNNRLILELLISQGVDINLLDKAGNTPLHYASKFGNIDICRYLVALNCLTGSRNTSGQSPYDVAESHTVRQFLLPLQFQEEAKHPDAIAQQNQPQDPFALGGRSQVPTNVAPPPVFSPTQGGGSGDLSANSPQVNNFYGQQPGYNMQNRYVAYPGMEDNSSTQPNTSTAPTPPQQYVSQGPTSTSSAQPPAVTSQFNPPAARTGHIIQPGKCQ
jgi:ankyrin repeat protein